MRGITAVVIFGLLGCGAVTPPDEMTEKVIKGRLPGRYMEGPVVATDGTICPPPFMESVELKPGQTLICKWRTQ